MNEMISAKQIAETALLLNEKRIHRAFSVLLSEYSNPEHVPSEALSAIAEDLNVSVGSALLLLNVYYEKVTSDTTTSGTH